LDIWGIDLDKKSINVAKQIVPNGEFRAISLGELKKENNIGKFDIITFFEVLEHQDKPQEFLNSIKALLRKGGFIAGSVPNRDSYFHKQMHQILGKGDYPPHHFLRFSSKALKFLFRKYNFKNIEIYNTHYPIEEIPYFLELKYFPWFGRIKYKIKSKFINPEIAKYIPLKEVSKRVEHDKLFQLQILKSADTIRRLFLYILGIPLLFKTKNNGFSFYFQAQTNCAGRLLQATVSSSIYQLNSLYALIAECCKIRMLVTAVTISNLSS